MPQSDRSPAFQFYPKDWLSDSNVARMPFAAKGMYIDLIAITWLDEEIPNNPTDLAELLRAPLDLVESAMQHLEKCFRKAPRRPGFWRHPRLDRERDVQSRNRKARSDSGSKGAKARWSGQKTDTENESGNSQLDGTAKNSPLAKNGSSSSSASSSSSSSPRDTQPTVSYLTGLDVAAYERWLAYRKSIRKAIRDPDSLEALQRRFVAMGDGQAVAVEHSIANSYQGLFEPKATTNGRRDHQTDERNRTERRIDRLLDGR